MGLRVEHPLVQANDARLREQQVVVLERLGEPKALHLVLESRLLAVDVVDGAIGYPGARGAGGGLEHLPALFHPRGVAGDAVHVPYRFDSFRSNK